MTAIRSARREDIPEILQMVRELAIFEKLESALVATVEDYERSFFGENPVAEALVAQTESGDLAGYAIFFSTFSSFLGKAGIWLEDIYVRPEFRGDGAGKMLLKEVAAVAHRRKAGRYEWCVLDRNRNAIDFYERSGAAILDEWRIVRMEGDEIRNLASFSFPE